MWDIPCFIIHVLVGGVLAETQTGSVAEQAIAFEKFPHFAAASADSFLSAALNRPHLVEVLSYVLMTSVSISLDASIGKSRLTTVFEILIFRPIRGFLASGPGFGEDILFRLLF